MNHAAIEQALSYDALSEAGRITGNSYKEDDATVWLGMALMQEQRKVKNELLSANRDTNSWGQTLAEWMAVVEDMGFRLILTDDIPGTGDKFRIWWRDGVLLKADSYSGDTTVNIGSAHFNYHGPRNAMHRCSSSWACDKDGVAVWDGSRDAREGLRFALDRMADAGTFLPKWEKQGFLWLLHYKDTKDKDYDYTAITAERIARLPVDVQDAIRGAA